MDPFKNTRTDSSPYSNRSGTSTPLYFSDTDFKFPIQEAEMTESSIHVKYDIDKDLLNVGHCKMSEARKRKIKRIRTCGYNREEAYKKSFEHFPQDRRLSDNCLLSPDMKTGHIIPSSARSDLPKPDDNDIMKHYKMGGARRKRYKWLIKNGYSKEEAALKSVYPMLRGISHAENFPKIRLEGNLYEVEGKQNLTSHFLLTNENKESATPNSPSKSVVGKEIYVQIGIFPAGFPEIIFKKDQFEALQDCLTEYILKDKVSMPQFRGTICKNGWLQITCANMTAVEWVKEIIPFLKPWKGAQLIILEEKDFPKPMNLICFLPKSSMISNQCILDYLKKQNPKNFDIDSWKILYREDSFDMTKAIISIDDISAFLLAKDGAKLYYMLNSINFMVISTQLHRLETSPNFINEADKSMKPTKRENIAGPSRYISERENIAGPSRYISESSGYPSIINEASNHEPSLKGKNIRTSIKSNEYNIPYTRDNFERDPNRYTSHHNYGSYTSSSPLRNVEKEIRAFEDHLRRDRRAVELERKHCQPYTPRRSRSPRRYYDDHRGREGNRRGSNSLALFPRRY